jgi:hypothetical protein
MLSMLRSDMTDPEGKSLRPKSVGIMQASPVKLIVVHQIHTNEIFWFFMPLRIFVPARNGMRDRALGGLSAPGGVPPAPNPSPHPAN